MSDYPGLSRRQFLRTGTCGTMGLGSLINTVTQLQLINAAAAADVGGNDVIGSDYKAIVCLFLRGGCDMNNVLIPVAGNPQAAGYTADRDVVGIRNGVVDATLNPTGENDTLPITVPGGDPFGLHPALPNLASMYGTGDAAFVANVGTLAQPTTSSTYRSVALPKQLFSHSDQQTEWMSSIADKPYTSGWGARVADLYDSSWNPQSQSSMLITAAGNNQFLNGGDVNQYSVTSSGAISLASFGTNYSSALDGNGDYRTNSTGQRLKALERIMAYSHGHLLEDGYSAVVRRARENEAIITEASTVATGLGLDFDTTWNTYGADSGVADELKAIAKLIAGRDCLGNKRQIFFVDIGGFDTHQDINADLAAQLGKVDAAIGAFNQAMKDLAAADADFEYDKVTTFQASDFNRTWTPNSDNAATAGTDHAWGTHTFMFGGAVNGGNVYGTFPELAVGGLNDVPSGSRGRWIPTTSVDQHSAVLAKWFGVPVGSTEMATILPNLDRFESIDATAANLGFL
ncbi:DUF1501 domain-containing protein [Akkermansiaceae bacterium]|nr:DUF1501 domain-containing protein [Akkermansiaceae bacterium]MDA7936051.1 DUF1501 domain-containing protein [bacterium]